MSGLFTFTRTCHMQNMSPGKALLEHMLDGTCHTFERSKSTLYSLVNPDGSRYTVFAGLDPPQPPIAAIHAATCAGAQQNRTDDAHSITA